MRPGVIIAIIAAVVVVIGGVWWYNQQAEQTRLEQQRADEAAQIAREEELARQETEAIQAPETTDADVAAPDDATLAEEEVPADAALAEEETPGDDQAALTETEAPVEDDEPIVVGDEVTEDAIVVESPGDAVILEDDAATTAELVDEAEPAGAAPDAGTAAAPEDDTAAAPETDTAAATEAPAADPEELLTPANFDPDEVIALIDTSDQLTEEERSSLRALVEGADANPELVDSTIAAIRTALDLPPLD